MSQRRKALLEWAEYHEAEERDAKDLLLTQPWSQVIRIHRIDAHLKARRVEVEKERLRPGWTPTAAKAAEEELNRLEEENRRRISESKAYLAKHLGVWRKEAENHARLRREFEHRSRPSLDRALAACPPARSRIPLRNRAGFKWRKP